MILHLKELMRKHSITSIEMAEKLDVSKATISYWINGKVFPTPDMLEKIATALNVPLWQLFAAPNDVASTKDTGAKVKCPNCGQEFEVELKPKST